MRSSGFRPSLRLRLVIALVLATTGRARCYFDNSTGTLLPIYRDPSTGNVSCQPGYFCPGLDPANASTYPVACIPSLDCAQYRVFGALCPDPQGDFEPRVCPRGFYCPAGESIEPLPCPAGTYCNFGSITPTPCPALGICSEGTIHYFGGLVLLAILTVVGAVGIVAYKWTALRSEVTLEATSPLASSSPVQVARHVSPTEMAPTDLQTRCLDLLVAGFRKARGGQPPCRFDFSGMHVELRSAEGRKCLLRDCTGHLLPGKVTAIMGPSGCGKTVFLNTLLGKTESDWEVSGRFTINGSLELSNSLRHEIGFVPQEDVLHTELSVFKNIYYSSEIRLPGSWTSEEKAVFRSAVLGSLGLLLQRDVLIGDEFHRGVSGGERRRASIGVELVAAPIALFLDQPTTSLDTTSARDLCSTLKSIATTTELTVAMILHQPRREIWESLDEVLFMGHGGRVIYQGPQSQAQAYFETVWSVVFSPQCNPADVILDTIAKLGPLPIPPTLGAVLAEQAVAGESHRDVNAAPVVDGVVRSTPPQSPASADPAPVPSFRRTRLPFGAELWLALRRSLEKTLAQPEALRLELLLTCLFGALLGWVMLGFTWPAAYITAYKRISPSANDDIGPQFHLYTSLSIALFSAAAGYRVFGIDRETYFRETAAGHSRLAYFIGTVIAASFRVIYLSLVFACLYMEIGGLPIDFWEFWAVMGLLRWCTYCTGFVVAFVTNRRTGPLVAQVVGIALSTFSGYVGYPSFLKHLSFTFYAAEILQNMWSQTVQRVFQTEFSAWGYQQGHIPEAFVAMIGLAFLLKVIAFILMTMMERNRQR